MVEHTSLPCPGCTSFERCAPRLVRCSRCGLGRTLGDTQPIDDQNYLTANESAPKLRTRYFHHLVATYFGDRPPGRSLDIGCGSGEFVRVLAAHGWTAHGIDAYRDFPADGVHFFRATIETFAGAGPYDVVTLVHSLEHMPDPVAALRQIKNFLRPDSQLLIVVPNFGGLWSRQQGLDWAMLNLDHHLFHFTLTSLQQVLERSGFCVTRLRTYSGYYAPSPWQVALGARKFYDTGLGSYQPLRSLVFRANVLLRPLMNRVVDWRNDGAEIHAVGTLQS